MSTENEGAAVTPAAGPNPTPPAPADAPSTGAPTSREGSDFSPASPDSPASAASSPSSGAAAPTASSSSPVADRTQDGPAVQDDVVPQRGGREDTVIMQPQQEAPSGGRTNASAEGGPGFTEPGAGAGAGAGVAPSAPPAPAGPLTAMNKSESGGAGQGDTGQGGAGQGGGWGYGDPGTPTPPPPPPYGAGGGGQGGPVGPGGPGGVPPHDPWAMPPAGGPGPDQGKKRRGALIAGVVVAALVAGGVGGGLGFWAADRGSNGDTTTITSSSDPKTLNRSPKSVAGIAAKALPSVVTIQSSGGGEEGTGTGFVFDKEGHILTNNHVVANGARGGKLTATFSDGKKYDAQVVGEAQGYDVAVIKLKGAGDRKLTPLSLANSSGAAVGDATIAIGAPFGLSGTVTTGIISAKNRPVASSDGQGANPSYMSALQTDASINPGNSGGPLLNSQGAVIGINSAIQPAGGGGGGGMGGQGQSGSVGLGFAIPVNQAKRVAGQLIKTGEPVYPVIGATVELGGGGNGATISQNGEGGSEAVPSGSPAEKAGLKSGDRITKLNDTVIDSGPTLIGTIWTHKPGEKVKLTYERDGQEHTAELTLGSRKGDK
ncbi:trypsin-like peptidase domain-containing protein [Streptomyces sp. NBC_01186]|nr:trypsin-like peptidase domain-containing protein [Streptomyces sp. NBC_01186]